MTIYIFVHLFTNVCTGLDTYTPVYKLMHWFTYLNTYCTLLDYIYIYTVVYIFYTSLLACTIVYMLVH